MTPPTRCQCGHIGVTHRWRWNTQLGQGIRHQCFANACPCSRYEPAQDQTPTPDIADTLHHLKTELAATQRALRAANKRLHVLNECPFLPDPSWTAPPTDLTDEAAAFLNKGL